jgi:hypothetical protein
MTYRVAQLPLHAVGDKHANFLCALELWAEAAQWSMITPRERPVKTSAKIVRYDRSLTFQMAEVSMRVTCLLISSR